MVGHPSYELHSMDMHAPVGDNDYDQEESLLQHEDGLKIAQPKRVYKNSPRTLFILGGLGSMVLAIFIFTILYLFAHGKTSVPEFRAPRFGSIGCEYPGTIITPLLEQNLTLLQDGLEIVTTGRSIGDIVFHSEVEDALEYVRLDVKLQGAERDDLHSVYTRVREGRYELQTPETSNKCMRYTLDIWLPMRLSSLIIRTETLTHISFSDIDMNSSISDLSVKISGDANNNLLVLPEARVTNAMYSLATGYIIGTTLLYNSLSMMTGAAEMNVEIVLMEDEHSAEPAYHELDFSTSTTGLHQVSVKNPQKYPFQAHHASTEATNMQLSYPDTFSGEISLDCKTLSTVNLRPPSSTAETNHVVFYRGDRDDQRSDLRVKNDLGHLGLQFE